MAFFPFYLTASNYHIKDCLDFSMLLTWIRILVSITKHYPIFKSNYIFNRQIKLYGFTMYNMSSVVHKT